MKDIQQLIKKNSQEGRYESVFPKTFTDAVIDRENGAKLTDILAMFNMLFLSYVGSKSLTRLEVPISLRKTGIWITYVLYDKTVVTEWYAGEAIDDTSFSNDSNWRDGTNSLVGDISISSDGYWVINGEVTTIEAQGEAGITPILRVGSNNYLQVSYTNGSSYIDVSPNPVYTQFRVSNNKLEQSVDLGLTWTVASDYIAAWFRFTGTTGSSQADNVGKIQISRDNGATWSDLSGEFTNSLYIKGYVANVGTLPSTAVQGDIYGVGPTYDSSDTEQTNPIYQLYVKDSTGWVNNGRFTSIAAGVVQTTGTSTTEVMSQDAITRELTELKSEVVPNTIATSIIRSSDYNIVGLVRPDGVIVDIAGSPYRHTSAFRIGANEALKMRGYANSANVALLAIYSEESCSNLLYAEVGYDDMALTEDLVYHNEVNSDVWCVLTTKTPFVENSCAIYGENVFVNELFAKYDTKLTELESELNYKFVGSYKEGFYTNSLGAEVEDANFLITTHFDIGNLSAIRWGYIHQNSNAKFCCYDANGGLVDYFSSVQNTTYRDVTISTGTAYIVAPFGASDIDTCYLATTDGNVIWKPIKGINGRIDTLEREANGKLLLHTDEMKVIHGVATWNEKTFVEDSRSPYVTRFIPVKENQMLYMNVGVYPSAYQLFVCDKNRNFIENSLNIRGAENKSNSELLRPYALMVKIPNGVEHVGVTNREDEYTPIIKLYGESEVINAEIRTISTDYDLTPRQGHISFIVDGGYSNDERLKGVFDSKGVKAGWALLYPWVWESLDGMGMRYDLYLKWQNEGHEILVHSGSSSTFNGIDYSVPSNADEQRAFAKMRLNQFRSIGYKARGFVQLGSQIFSSVEARKPVYYAFEYAFTRATNNITEKDSGAVMMPTDKPWNLGRSTLEIITLNQMKVLIDECADKKGCLFIYCHSSRIGNSSYPNQTWDTFAEMIDYAKSKCKIDTPYNCVKALYANHIE